MKNSSAEFFETNRSKRTTVELNWYFNHNVRLTGNLVHTDFTGVTSASRATDHETGPIFCVQLMF